MSFTLVMNSSNVVGSNNNTFRYNFLSGNFTTKNSEMCISNVVIPYSWYNISSNYANNLLSIEFPTAAFTYV